MVRNEWDFEGVVRWGTEEIKRGWVEQHGIRDPLERGAGLK